MNRSQREQRLAHLYDECAARVHAYLVRHCGPDGADDLLSEVFVVAARRLEDVPDPALPWLIVTARNLTSNHRRSARRRENLRALLVQQPRTTASSAEDAGLARIVLADAFATLTEREQEAILLVTWDGLSIADAAEVAGCRERAFRARLESARRRLSSALDEPDPGPRPSPVLHPLDDGAPS